MKINKNDITTMIFAIALIVVLFLYGCSAQQRINRIVKNNPHVVVVDTVDIMHRDTIYIESASYDTVTSIVMHDSTIVVNNNRVLLKYYYDTLKREIWHEVECKDSTIYYEKLIHVPVQTIKVEQKTNRWWYILAGIGGILFMVWFIRVIVKT